ncbi:hypothetical protein [Vreelandella sp. TE19]
MEFDANIASRECNQQARYLVKAFVRFAYFGVFSSEGVPYLLIDTRLGECEVFCFKGVDVPDYRIDIRCRGERRNTMSIFDAISFLLANGAPASGAMA